MSERLRKAVESSGRSSAKADPIASGRMPSTVLARAPKMHAVKMHPSAFFNERPL